MNVDCDFPSFSGWRFILLLILIGSNKTRKPLDLVSTIYLVSIYPLFKKIDFFSEHNPFSNITPVFHQN